MLKVHQIPVANCAQFWPAVAPHIEKCLKYTDDFNLDQIKILVLTGAWVLMVAADEQGVIHGASTMAFVNDLNFRTAVVTALGGKGVVTDELFAQYCAVAKSLGATRMQTHARPSSARLYEKIGFRNKAALMELKL